MRTDSVTLAAIVLAAALAARPAAAQLPNPFQAAKDAFKHAMQQAGQQMPGQVSQPNAARQRAASTAASAATSGTSEPDSSCCTAEAMKAMAAQAHAADMVGVKLGMTPQQATAAIKAHSPAMRLYTVNMRVTHPGASTFVAMPHYIVATNEPPGRTLPVGQEVILLEFSTPPNAPVLTVASRYSTFEPTLVGNLVNELDKKYGAEYPRHGARAWVYDAGGKPVTVAAEMIDNCVASNLGPLGGAIQAPNNSLPQPGFDSGSLDVNTYRTAQATGGLPRPECMPYSVIKAENIGTDLGPNTQTNLILVTMTSGALSYASIRSSHDWLQAEFDGKAKAAHDAAAQRTGTDF